MGNSNANACKRCATYVPLFIRTCPNLTMNLRQGLNMILPEDGGPPRPGGLVLRQVDLSGRAKEQGANDEDEEEEGELSV